MSRLRNHENVMRVRHNGAAISVRLLSGPDTATTIGREYGVSDNTVCKVWRQYSTPEERRAAQHRKCSEKQKGRPCPHQRNFLKGTIRGAAARRYCPVGTIRVRTNGKCRPARWIKVDDRMGSRDNWKFYATVLWERAHGPVPKGWCVIHVDGRSMNDEPENLECVTFAERIRRTLALSPKAEARRVAGVRKARHRRAEVDRAKRMIRESAPPEPAVPELEVKPSARERGRANLSEFLRDLAAA